MRIVISRLFGILFMIAALAGVVCSVLGVYLVWREIADISTQVDESLNILVQTMITTREGLLIMETTLDNASLQVENIQSTAAGASDTLVTTSLTLDSLSELFGVKLTNIVTDTQFSLSTAETSATLIDNTLMFISSIPLIGSRYEPQTSLAVSLDQISESLGALPASFSEIEQNLSTTSSNLDDIQKDIEDLYTNMNDIKQNLEDAQVVVMEYQDIVSNIGRQILQLQENIPVRLNRVALGVTFILTWMMISSLGLFIQGFGLFQVKKQN